MQSLAIAAFIGVNLGIIVLWLSHLAQQRDERCREAAAHERCVVAEPSPLVSLGEFQNKLSDLVGVDVLRPQAPPRFLVTPGTSYSPVAPFLAPSERLCRVEISPDGGRTWYPTANDRCRESSAKDLAAKIEAVQPHIKVRVVEAA